MGGEIKTKSRVRVVSSYYGYSLVGKEGMVYDIRNGKVYVVFNKEPEPTYGIFLPEFLEVLNA